MIIILWIDIDVCMHVCAFTCVCVSVYVRVCFFFNQTLYFTCWPTYEFWKMYGYVTVPQSGYKIFPLSQKFLWPALQPFSTPTPVPGDHWSALYHCRLNLSFLVSYKWNYTVYTLTCLASFIQHNILKNNLLCFVY